MEPFKIPINSIQVQTCAPGTYLPERAFAAWLADQLGEDALPSRLFIRRLRRQGMPFLLVGNRTDFQPEEAWAWILGNGMHRAQARPENPKGLRPIPSVVPSVRRKAG